ncbi:MAG: crosslink repair DNA glycosylase YcaQ family protein, partial [Actinomycetota bacterium]
YMLMRAELDSVICSGPRRGKQHTFALLEDRAPDARRLDPDEALAELTRRYFTARGPATVRDYCAWSSLTVAQARRGLEMVEGELHHEESGGRTYWISPNARRAPASPGRIDLVQVYDETIMGYTESRDALYLSSAQGRVPGAEEAWMHGTLLDGRLVGRWKPVESKKSISMQTTFFRPLTRAERPAFGAAVERYASFRGLPVTLP